MSPRRAAPTVNVRIMRLPHASGLPLPSPQSVGAAGVDLQAAIDAHAPLVIAPGARALVPTGYVIELPAGYEAQVRPRSGLALHNGIAVLNSPGTIDADYRGEVQVILANLGGAAFEVRRADRIAQLVVQPVVAPRWIEASEVRDTTRGAGGFGSTGVATKEAAKKKKLVLRAAQAKKARVKHARQNKPRHRT